MGKLKILGVILIVWSLVCLVFNFFFHVDFGEVGGYLFNPFGVLLSGQISSLVVNANLVDIPIIGDWIVNNVVGVITWMIGGVIALVWSIGLFFLGLWLAKH